MSLKLLMIFLRNIKLLVKCLKFVIADISKDTDPTAYDEKHLVNSRNPSTSYIYPKHH